MMEMKTTKTTDISRYNFVVWRDALSGNPLHEVAVIAKILPTVECSSSAGVAKNSDPGTRGKLGPVQLLLLPCLALPSFRQQQWFRNGSNPRCKGGKISRNQG